MWQFSEHRRLSSANHIKTTKDEDMHTQTHTHTDIRQVSREKRGGNYHTQSLLLHVVYVQLYTHI